MITTIFSGGQTGADQGGLRAGRILGLKTAGYAPLGWRTEAGPAPWLASYGLVQCDSSDYEVRTELNIIMAEATVIFGKDSSGSRLTHVLCKELGKPHLWLPCHQLGNEQAELRLWIERNGFKSLNTAGNRESKMRGIGTIVEQCLVEVLPLCRRPPCK